MSLNQNHKILYIHIGLHKTATSSIQLSLHKNRELLLNNEILYPESLGINHSVPIFSMFSDDPASVYGNVIKGKQDTDILSQFEQTKTNLLNEIKQEEPQKVILSGEGISVMPRPNVLKLKDFLKANLPEYQIHFICFVRNPKNFLSSEYQELVKGGFPHPKIATKIFRPRIAKFKNNFDKASWHIEKFEDACLHPNGPVGRFLEIIQVNPNLHEFKHIRQNESLSHQAVELIQFINSRYPLLTNKQLNNGRVFKDTFAFHQLKGSKFILPEQYFREKQSLIDDDIDWLNQIFEIQYPTNEVQKKIEISYSKNYCNEFIAAFENSSFLIRILSYLFVVHKASQKQTDIFHKLEKYIRKNWPLVSQVVFENEKLVAKNIELLIKNLNISKKSYSESLFELSRYFEDIGLLSISLFALKKIEITDAIYPEVENQIAGVKKRIRESQYMKMIRTDHYNFVDIVKNIKKRIKK